MPTLKYYINNKLKETIMVDKPMALVKWKRDMLSESTHKKGKFKITKRNGKS